MMAPRTADVGIIGCGIAGATLADSLLRRGATVVVFDSPLRAAVTRHAGAISPVAGLRFGILEQWEQWWKAAEHFYAQFDAIREIPCYRLLYRSDELGFWERKRPLLEQSNIAYEASLPSDVASVLVPPAATVYFTHAARINATRVLENVQRQLRKAECYCCATIHPEHIRLLADRSEIMGYYCRHVVVCDGPWMAINKWFSWVPRMFARGQRIWGVVETTQRLAPVWLSIRGKSLMLEANRFIFGSTYDWSLVEPVATADSVEYLCNELRKILRCAFSVQGTWAGVRPITADLHPVIGEHPECSRWWVFNGLGSRGLLIAPLLAEKLASAILEGYPIPKQFDVRRFLQNRQQ
ncbi:MAG: FAD-dependent oxidoreductase [Bacteroidota bacterium]|nr:FAD-binding oxidoreductase [Candidatus Kapabacteria bacterium]MCS7302598.1 FAD-binding oxidoreductase [Candidatus Kapabacteria bacterium]MDW8074251.1 FAD-dependent oxidoreductase [Bacteroidota bacterium]MDW8271273.1 FAD-dependent oxidoreductase [Bacteroidota bacterium]